jgi:two-component system, LytTR family, response regulator
MKVIIIEDNSIDTAILTHILQKISPDINICGNAKNINQAIELIENHQPDVIFSDIALKDGSAFHVFETLKQKNIPISALIFMSSSQNFENALKAIAHNCLAFMTKPLSKSIVSDALNKANIHINNPVEINILSAQHPVNRKIIVSIAHNNKIIIDKDTINYFEAKGQCTIIHLVNGTHMTAFHILGYYQKLLVDDTDFFLIHRSFLVNLKQVKNFQSKTNKITVGNNIVLTFSRRHGLLFKAYWNKLYQKF